MKKGFIFIETLIVLVVLMITVVGMYGIYIKLSSNIENRKYYDNISDLYKTDIIRDYINLTTINENIIEITKDNCSNYMKGNCTEIINTLKVEKIFISNNNLINGDNINNSMKQYLKTINIKERIIIVNYKYDNKNYYASLNI